MWAMLRPMLGLWLVAQAQAQAGEGTCDADGTCGAAGAPASTGFWAAAKANGMEIRLAPPKKNGTGMRTTEDIFYGRHIFRLPRSALLSNETVEPKSFRLALRDFLEDVGPKHNMTSVEDVHLLATCLALLAEQRNPDSRFRPWLDKVANDRLLVLELTAPQRQALQGTTVEGSYEEMVEKRDMVRQSAGNFSLLADTTDDEAAWAVSVVLLHSRTVHPPADEASKRPARMCLLPREEILGLELSPHSDLSITFQEELMKHQGQERYFVTQIARADMVKGSKVFVYPGHLSNSELILRFNRSFPDTPIGIGRNVSQPANWVAQSRRDGTPAPIMQEYGKYNCSHLESFELRFSPKGKPMKNYVKCFRVSWLMANGWYSPLVIRMAKELEKWPPPKKYSHEDWLAWTQADLELNRVLRDYCGHMKAKLDETDFELVETLKTSADPADQSVWQVVKGERQAFENCLQMCDKVAGPR